MASAICQWCARRSPVEETVDCTGLCSCPTMAAPVAMHRGCRQRWLVAKCRSGGVSEHGDGSITVRCSACAREIPCVLEVAIRGEFGVLIDVGVQHLYYCAWAGFVASIIAMILLWNDPYRYSGVGPAICLIVHVVMSALFAISPFMTTQDKVRFHWNVHAVNWPLWCALFLARLWLHALLIPRPERGAPYALAGVLFAWVSVWASNYLHWRCMSRAIGYRPTF